MEIKIKWIPRKQMTHENTYRDDMTEGIQTFAHYRQTYKAKQFLLRVLFTIGFVLFTRFYFQSLLP